MVYTTNIEDENGDESDAHKFWIFLIYWRLPEKYQSRIRL